MKSPTATSSQKSFAFETFCYEVARWRATVASLVNLFPSAEKFFSSRVPADFKNNFRIFFRKKFIFFEKFLKFFLKIQLKIDKKKNRKKSSWFFVFSAKIFLKNASWRLRVFAVYGEKSAILFLEGKNSRNSFP